MAYNRTSRGLWICTSCDRVRGSHEEDCRAAAVERSIERRSWGKFPWTTRSTSDE